MKSSDLIQKALEQQRMTEVETLKKRVAELEKRVAALEPKPEPAPPPMTDPELDAWAKAAADAITHITEIDVCFKCDRTISYQVPCGQWEYPVTCPRCKATYKKTRF